MRLQRGIGRSTTYIYHPRVGSLPFADVSLKVPTVGATGSHNASHEHVEFVRIAYLKTRSAWTDVHSDLDRTLITTLAMLVNLLREILRQHRWDISCHYTSFRAS
jgi:hypothetical protein